MMYKIKLLILIFVIVIYASAYAQTTSSPVISDNTANTVQTPDSQSAMGNNQPLSYQCGYASTPIIIDGKLDDKAWGKAVPLKLVIPVTNTEPQSKTYAAIMWNEDYLFVAFKAYDKDLKGIMKSHDNPTYKDDCLEIFIRTNQGHIAEYYNFEFNILGVFYDAFTIMNEDGVATPFEKSGLFNCEGIKSAITFSGTINNSEDTDEYWILEAAIPFKSLPSLKGKFPEAGTKWSFLLGRYDYSNYISNNKELSTTAKLTKVKFHSVFEYSILEFIK